MEKKKMSQEDVVLAHLEQYGSISSLEAFGIYGITRLGARIWNLRNGGFDIDTQIETTTNRLGGKSSYAKYVLRGNA